ncbi:MAG TPA: copper resistance CopC family protein [Ornithinimicrobium sp.]|uniref:copper resistance CopC family protein n=1 Tax=Ornithinimicrobium sp. TaxID=1977084 RepID=UPI002B478F01|nr:copper resistance CopC family protein [Ornithinimicrobium sp.]HKJ11142.1 copper resistance CopC family protein [Ornithinimicrobium sp.]
MGRVRAGRRGGGAVIGAVVLVAATALTASAHDELTGTTPADGASVDPDTAEVRLEFSGAVAEVGTVVEVTGPDGAATQGEPEIDGTAVVQPVEEDLPPGPYTVRWRVTSQDGHPISGDFSYTVVGEASPTTSSDPATQEPPTADSESDSATAVPTGDDAAVESAGTDHAADTAAAPAQGDDSADSSPPWWVWAVLALAVLTVGGLGAVAVRRR